MQTQISLTHSRSRRGMTLSALFALGVVFIGLLVLWPVLSPSASQSAAANVTAPDIPLAKERAEEHQWLVQRSAASAAVVVATQRQEAAKDRWLERSTASNASMSPVQRQEELKDQWLLRR